MYILFKSTFLSRYDATMQQVVVNLVDIWSKTKSDDQLPSNADDFKSLIPEQVEEFCALLLEREPLPLDRLKKLDHLYDLSSIKNTEIKFRYIPIPLLPNFTIDLFSHNVSRISNYRWLRLCIRSRWEEKIDEALAFATEQGRMKYVRPIFRYNNLITLLVI